MDRRCFFFGRSEEKIHRKRHSIVNKSQCQWKTGQSNGFRKSILQNQKIKMASLSKYYIHPSTRSIIRNHGLLGSIRFDRRTQNPIEKSEECFNCR